MEKLELLETIGILVQTGEADLGEPVHKIKKLLDEITALVKQETIEQIYQDITEEDTGYYAPEYPSFREFLKQCNGHLDYSQVLDQFYSEEHLEALWNSSHIMDGMTRRQIHREMLESITWFREQEILDKEGYKTRVKDPDWQIRAARLKGLYYLIDEI